MSNFTQSDIFVTDLPDGVRRDFKKIYDSDPNTITKLCDFPGRIGELARICQAVGCDKS
jgi:hypothetical protein